MCVRQSTNDDYLRSRSTSVYLHGNVMWSLCWLVYPCWVCWQNIVYLYQPCCVAKNQGIIDHTTIILYLFDVFYRNTKFLFSTFHVVFSHPIHSHPGFHCCVTHTHSWVDGFVYAPAPLTHNVIITPSKKAQRIQQIRSPPTQTRWSSVCVNVYLNIEGDTCKEWELVCQVWCVMLREWRSAVACGGDSFLLIIKHEKPADE